MSKISTFGSTFESYWINPSVTFTREISKNFQFFVIFLRGQSSPDFWPMIKVTFFLSGTFLKIVFWISDTTDF